MLSDYANPNTLKTLKISMLFGPIRRAHLILVVKNWINSMCTSFGEKCTLSVFKACKANCTFD